MPVRPQAILFDFDGTLVDSEPLHYEAWLHAVGPYGATTDWVDYQERFVGQSGRWAAETFFDDAGVTYDETLVARVVGVKSAYFRRFAPERLVISAATLAAILQLPPELPVGVVSSSARIEVEPALEKSGLRARLAAVIYGEDVQRHKPDPEPYLLAFERLQVVTSTAELRPSAVAVYEDSTSGIASAEAAGMAVRKVLGPEYVAAMLASESWHK